MKIIFMGTPEFAVPAMQRLLGSEHQVTAVFTQAPKPRDRGLQQRPSPVHLLANAHQIPLHTPKSLRNDEATNLIKIIDADIIVVVAYGFIIPEAILNAKKYGCLNIHPSALPRFRGAAPLQRTIIAGDKTTDICIMQMDAGLDTGDVILRERIELDPRITLKELHDQCALIGADLLIKVLDNIATLPRTKQSEEGLVYAPKLTKEGGLVSWNDSAFSIDCKIRGMTPWPGVYFVYKDQNIKILEAEYNKANSGKAPGIILSNSMDIACGSGILRVKKLQRPGKSPVSGEEFLRACRMSIGESLV